tara:strand:+ start:2253 stop:3041 length:789 start_codon:yes stop_codon:yes gene_type:complete
MKLSLNYRIQEPEKIYGGRFSLTKDIMNHLFDNAKIDRKFNNFLKDKSVIIVGPAPYTKNKKRADYIESFDVIVRLNKQWNISEDMQEFIGKRTDIRYHCGMEQSNNGGPWDIEEMKKYGVKWAAINFPEYLDYFHDDVQKFKTLNKDYNLNFHCFSDLELYCTIHHHLGTRMNVGTAAALDLMFYDIKSLHIMGMTFFQGGHVEGYKEKRNVDFLKTVWDEENLALGPNHAQKPQQELIKMLHEMDNRLTLDDEVKEVIYK